jgi:superfamily II DNA/RNA helicase
LNRYGAGPIGVIVAPTRELAHQIFVEARKYSKAYGVVTCAVYGGMNKHEQWKALKAGCDVIVCTPVHPISHASFCVCSALINPPIVYKGSIIGYDQGQSNRDVTM